MNARSPQALEHAGALVTLHAVAAARPAAAAPPSGARSVAPARFRHGIFGALHIVRAAFASAPLRHEKRARPQVEAALAVLAGLEALTSMLAAWGTPDGERLRGAVLALHDIDAAPASGTIQRLARTGPQPVAGRPTDHAWRRHVR